MFWLYIHIDLHIWEEKAAKRLKCENTGNNFSNMYIEALGFARALKNIY